MSKRIYCLAVAILLCIETIGICVGEKLIFQFSAPYKVSAVSDHMEELRSQHISEKDLSKLKKIAKQSNEPFPKVLTIAWMSEEFALKDSISDWSVSEFEKRQTFIMDRYLSEYEQLHTILRAVWEDVRFFPIPESIHNKQAYVSYENSWMYERNYKGKRGHEGTDLMPSMNKRGYFPIISMTDGVIEKIGWLDKSGYRIGIRSPNGGYYFYAHLYKYAKQFQIGDKIKAGQWIGYMGDSGYGKEGTTGQFPVHLHLGIYYNDKEGNEISVNPYPVLKYIEDTKVQYAY